MGGILVTCVEDNSGTAQTSVVTACAGTQQSPKCMPLEMLFQGAAGNVQISLSFLPT